MPCVRQVAIARLHINALLEVHLEHVLAAWALLIQHPTLRTGSSILGDRGLAETDKSGLTLDLRFNK